MNTSHLRIISLMGAAASLSASAVGYPNPARPHYVPRHGGTPVRSASKRQKYRAPEGYATQERDPRHIHQRHRRTARKEAR